MSRNVIESPSNLPVSLEVESHTNVRERNMREIDRRETAGYDVVALMRKDKGKNHFFLALEPKEEALFFVPEPIELPPPSEKVPNRVKHSLEHPMIYYAAAGVAIESFFSGHDIPEAA